MAHYTDEEIRWEIQKQMGCCIAAAQRTPVMAQLVVTATWPDGATHSVRCTDYESDGWQTSFIALAVSKLSAWREIKVLEEPMPHPETRCWLSLPSRLQIGA
ncbi:hypothetical protein [Ferrovibrio terrae]|uniref:hypothetical protein n=1 Tax=Ferrovibrio terrae TaxID=2594003 RepID=UPI003137C5A1